MPDLSRRMKSAADAPQKELELGMVLRRGRQLWVRRAIATSTLSLLMLSGSGLVAYQVASGDRVVDRKSDDKIASTDDSVTEHCKDRDPESDDENVRYCIAKGTLDGLNWAWYAFYNDHGDLCQSFNAPGGGGGSCGRRWSTDSVGMKGLSTGGVLDPTLEATLTEEAATAFVETLDGERREMHVFDAPRELGIRGKYAVYFRLPRDAKDLVVVDSSGDEIARVGLYSLMGDDPLQANGDDDGAVIASDPIGTRFWTLSADWRRDVPIHCVLLDLGNSYADGDVELSADWCSRSLDVEDLLLEQMWWSGLDEVAPVFGSVPPQTSSLTLELENSSEPIPIRESLMDWSGFDPAPVYDTDFVVAFPPLGSSGQIVARTADGSVISTWDLCLDEQTTDGVDYTACDDQTEFWTRPR